TASFPLLELSSAHSSLKAYPVLVTRSLYLPLFVTKALPTLQPILRPIFVRIILAGIIIYHNSCHLLSFILSQGLKNPFQIIYFNIFLRFLVALVAGGILFLASRYLTIRLVEIQAAELNELPGRPLENKMWPSLALRCILIFLIKIPCYFLKISFCKTTISDCLVISEVRGKRLLISSMGLFEGVWSKIKSGLKQIFKGDIKRNGSDKINSWAKKERIRKRRTSALQYLIYPEGGGERELSFELSPYTRAISTLSATDEDQIAFLELKINYQSFTGMLNYLAFQTQPDLASVVSILSRFKQRPSSCDWRVVLHCWKYLKGLGLLLRPEPKNIVVELL
ncbi:hypothetical protein VP01_5542g1, partial [Puccinia sorghi]